jgi:hypothetical protein
LVRGNWGRSKTSCPWASRASSVLGSSVPGIGRSRKGAGSTLAMATASKEARAGVKGGQPRADERERFRAFERDSSRWNAPWFTGVRLPSRGAVQTWILVARSGEWVSVHAYASGHDSGCTSKESRRGPRAPKALVAFARSLSAFASPFSARRRDGVTPRRRETRLLTSRAAGSLSQGGEKACAGQLGSWPRSQGEERQLGVVPVRRFVLQKSVSRRRARNREVAEARHRHRV